MEQQSKNNTNLLSQFDTEYRAILNPDEIIKKAENFPETVVINFTKSIIDKWAKMSNVRTVSNLYSANGVNPVYAIKYKGVEIGFTMALVGASSATGICEELIAMGAKKIIAFGSCGVLDRNIADGHIIIPYEAVRDEGTSYHYAPPSDSIFMNENCVQALESVLTEFEYPYIKGKTWTTDAIYRETRAKAENRKKMGCICVEMECSAMIAVCAFRNIPFAQFLYAADNLDSEVWEQRGLDVNQGLSCSERYMQIAFECALKLQLKNQQVKVIIDRPLGSFHPKHNDIFYSVNYGYVPNTLAPDGEEQDAYILGIDEPLKEFVGEVIAIIHRRDDIETKWIVVPSGITFTENEIKNKVYFQEQYFDFYIEML